MPYQPQNLHCNYLNLVNLNIWTSCQLHWRHAMLRYVSRRPWIQYMIESIHNELLFFHIIFKQYHIIQAFVYTAVTYRSIYVELQNLLDLDVCFDHDNMTKISHTSGNTVPLYDREKPFIHVMKCLATGKKFYHQMNGRIFNITVP